MVPNTATICPFGWKARDFALKGVDGKTYSLAAIRGPKGTLVVFICNHCPYLKASIDRIVAEARALGDIGIGTIAIMPNDTETYAEDSFEKMKLFSAKHSFTFPYVIDETQEVARDLQCSVHTRLLWFQRARRAAVPRSARCFAHHAGRERSPRTIRGNEASGRDRTWTGAANSFYGMFNQVEALNCF